MKSRRRFSQLLTAVTFLFFSSTAPLAHFHPVEKYEDGGHPEHAGLALDHAHFGHEQEAPTDSETEENEQIHARNIPASALVSARQDKPDPVSAHPLVLELDDESRSMDSLEKYNAAHEHPPHGPPLILSRPLRAPPA